MVRQKHNKAICKVICNSSVVDRVSGFALHFKKMFKSFLPETESASIFRSLPQFLAIISFLGGVQQGDQLLNVDGTSLLGFSVEHALEELNKAMNRETVSCLIDA